MSDLLGQSGTIPPPWFLVLFGGHTGSLGGIIFSCCLACCSIYSGLFTRNKSAQALPSAPAGPAFLHGSRFGELQATMLNADTAIIPKITKKTAKYTIRRLAFFIAWRLFMVVLVFCTLYFFSAPLPVSVPEPWLLQYR
jgi:hypothetical protein